MDELKTQRQKRCAQSVPGHDYQAGRNNVVKCTKCGLRIITRKAGKLHLLRPQEGLTMCGRKVGTVRATAEPAHIDCKTCVGMYENNIDWYRISMRR